ncbi:hypothetical protein BUZ90_02890 [Mammaliicoccus sciuri]|nr:hypothetical protein BUZ90_02890 [Mammaliicoccus sciuri]
MGPYFLTQDQKEVVQSQLEETRRIPCSCNAPAVAVMNDISVLSIASNEFPGPTVAMINTVCDNCGNVQQFNASHFGLEI